jgi:hypothetical protein
VIFFPLECTGFRFASSLIDLPHSTLNTKRVVWGQMIAFGHQAA